MLKKHIKLKLSQEDADLKIISIIKKIYEIK